MMEKGISHLAFRKAICCFLIYSIASKIEISENKQKSFSYFVLLGVGAGVRGGNLGVIVVRMSEPVFQTYPIHILSL